MNDHNFSQHPRVTIVTPYQVDLFNAIAETGVTGLLVPPSDPRGLAEAIVSLLADKQRATIMGRAGRKRVRQYFSESQYLDAMLSVFKQAASMTRDTSIT